MITDAVGAAVMAVVGFLISFLPVAGALGLEGFGGAIAQFKAFNSALPVTEVIAMAGMCLTIIGGIFLGRLFITLYRLIPGKFT